MSASLKNLSERLIEVVNSLQAVENRLEDKERDWSLRRKTNPTDLYNFWSNGSMTNIEYVERIQEYIDLPKDDQKSLFLTNYSMFSWLPFVYKCYELKLDGIPLGDGSYLPAREQEYSHLPAGWKTLYEQVGRRLITEVVGTMEKIALTKEQYVLLRAAALMKPVPILSIKALTTVTAVQKALRTAILLTKPSSRESCLSDVDSIFQSLSAIGILETNALAHLSLPDDDETLFKSPIVCHTPICPN